MPPRIEPAVQMAPNSSAFFGRPSDSPISSGSGGMGKNDDSANEMPNSAMGPLLWSAHESIQS
jgi:hypothetical protein